MTELKESELKIDTYCDSRPAWQEPHRKWSVRIVHIPSGSVAMGHSTGDGGVAAKESALSDIRKILAWELSPLATRIAGQCDECGAEDLILRPIRSYLGDGTPSNTYNCDRIECKSCGHSSMKETDLLKD